MKYKSSTLKTITLLLIIFLFSVINCWCEPTPSSERSQNAIKSIKPALEKEFTEKSLSPGAPVFIRIFKKSKELEIWIKNEKKFVFFKSYRICTYGFRGLGPKTKQGDHRAPEGFYYVPPRFLHPDSTYYLAFDLGYPNQYDRAYNRTGSALMVHGDCVSNGCYAMDDKAITEIYAIADMALNNGQKFFRVHIFPFKMNNENMEKHKESDWIDFWKNLKQGYDFFENEKTPPDVLVRNKKYIFKTTGENLANRTNQ